MDGVMCVARELCFFAKGVFLFEARVVMLFNIGKKIGVYSELQSCI